ncbi:MAG: hypothetical protein IKB70_06285 [Bacilli bacterium]|nr:hypothetical protein [Bacilli bacterium]
MTDILSVIGLIVAAIVLTVALYALVFFCMSLYDIIFCRKWSSWQFLTISFLIMIITIISGVQLILLAKEHIPQTREIHMTVPEKAKVNAEVIYSGKTTNISDL